MLDIIIPCYNNPNQLSITLSSIAEQNETDRIKITIVDDASTEDLSTVINYFAQFLPIKVYRLEYNAGPGMARQYGLEHTSEPYIMFIDNGDVFFQYLLFSEALNIVQRTEEPHHHYWSFIAQSDSNKISHLEKSNENIFLHGKIYNRQLLNQHSIGFWPDHSYCNEDNVFNTLIQAYQTDQIIFYDEPLIVQVYYPKSISLINALKYEFQYCVSAAIIQTEKILSILSEESFEQYEDYIQFEAAKTMVFSYMSYMGATLYAPEYVEHNFQWAIYCYYNLYLRYVKNNAVISDYYYYSIQKFIERIRLLVKVHGDDMQSIPFLSFDFEAFLDKCGLFPNNADEIDTTFFNKIIEE